MLRLSLTLSKILVEKKMHGRKPKLTNFNTSSQF